MIASIWSFRALKNSKNMIMFEFVSSRPALHLWRKSDLLASANQRPSWGNKIMEWKSE